VSVSEPLHPGETHSAYVADICVMCAVWGVISACTGAVHNFAGLAVCRTFLGFAEAAFFPGAIYLLSTFYEKKKMALRSAILYTGSQIGNAFGGLFALAILELDGKAGLEGWRWLFIIEGALTVLLAAIFATFIPNTPSSVRWLTVEERAQLQYRLEVDRSSKDATDEVSVWEAFKLAVRDPKTWLLCSILQCNYIAASVTNFFPIVVSGLGFSRTVTLAITAPPYILCCIAITINGWHSDKKQERTLHIICPFIITIIANVIAISTTATAPRYVAMMLLPGSFYSASIVILSWISSAMTGPHVKRAIVYAMINALCNTPNIWTSYLYSNAPRYVLAFGVDLAASVGVVICAAATYLYLRNQNRKMDRGEPLGKSGPTQLQIESGFRYQL
jgi:MFS family permease